MGKVRSFLTRMGEEPPFRLFTKAIVKRSPVSIRTKARWDVVARPHYLVGVLEAADEALREGVKEISVFEFGVAGGNGLLALGQYSEAIQRETGIKIAVYGFDSGKGLVELSGDYRDHPDQWQSGDYPMDEAALRKRLVPNTTLIVGNISETVPKHLPKISEPIGFISVDVDTYSATREVLKLFRLPQVRKLRLVVMYFDDVDLIFNHNFAGELLAINEFNDSDGGVKIDPWRGVGKHRPFPDSPWLRRMFIAHDLKAISNFRADRKSKLIGIDDQTGATG